MEIDMTREEAIKELRGFIGQLTEGCQEAIKVLIPELAESEDETIRKVLVNIVKSACSEYGVKYRGDKITEGMLLAYLEKQKEQKSVHTAKEMWKEMRFEVYAQASGNRHEPNYSDDSTKMFSLCDIDEIFEKIGNSTIGSQSAEWSEEDEKMVETICKEGDLKPSEQRWLNSLKNRGNSPKSNDNSPIKDDQPAPEDSVIFQNGVAEGRRLEREEQKPEWSEEDERRYNQVVYLIEQYGGFQSESLYYQDKTIVGGGPKYILKSEVLDWFKSLKNRGNFPSWKPSEEELEALNYAIAEWDGGKRLEGLYALRNDLKKLI